MKSQFDEELLRAVRKVARELHIPVLKLTRDEFVLRYGRKSRDISDRWGELKKAAANYRDGLWEVPSAFAVKEVVAFVGADGDVKNQWVKAKKGVLDPEELLARLGKVVKDEITPRTVVVPEPRGPEDWEDVLAVYPMGDPHIGLYCAGRETGHNWNIEKATNVFKAAIDNLSRRGEPAATGLLIDLGDGLHADREGTTTKGTPVDTDGRWWEAVLAAIQLKIYQIDRLLEVHKKVVVWCVAGNHDRYSAFGVALALAHHYRNEPRVEIPVNPSPFYFYRHGECLIGSTHGDTVSPKKTTQLALLMAEKRAADWGQTKHRRWFIGHVHHRTVKEEIGCEIETFRTLARADAWHSREGYVSRRDMRRISFHKKWGEVDVAIVGGFALERFE